MSQNRAQKSKQDHLHVRAAGDRRDVHQVGVEGLLLALLLLLGEKCCRVRHLCSRSLGFEDGGKNEKMRRRSKRCLPVVRHSEDVRTKCVGLPTRRYVAARLSALSSFFFSLLP